MSLLTFLRSSSSQAMRAEDENIKMSQTLTPKIPSSIIFLNHPHREDNKVSHYIINKIQQGDQTRYKIGDQMFTDLPALLNFYKVHYLDTTPLIRPAPKRVEKVLAKYDFEGNVSKAKICCFHHIYLIRK